jgi:hypothetical protein
MLVDVQARHGHALRELLEDRLEPAARPAPRRPEIDEDRVGGDGVVERVGVELEHESNRSPASLESMRRILLLLAGFAVLALPAVAVAPGRADSDASRAEASFDAMERYFFDRSSGDYREQRGTPAGSHAWPFSQALAAQIALAAVPALAPHASVRVRLEQLERRFRQGTTYTASPKGSVYLDDNEWLAEDLLDWSALSGDSVSRKRAAAIFSAVTDAWDDAPSHPCPGGVYWTRAPANHDRNTVSTANGAVVALRLYKATKEPVYLAWSQRMLAWLDRCMLAPNGLYWDHIDLAGNVNRAQWSYNQGSVIVADVLLYRTTGSEQALAQAERLADASVAYFDRRWDTGEPPEFAAVFFRSLLSLADADGRSDYAQAAERYGDDAWSSERDPHTGLFRYSGRSSLLEQAALVQLYAALARHGATAGD